MGGDLIRYMQSLFPAGADPRSESVWEPPTDVYRTRDGWLVKLDLAGVRPEDVQLTLHGTMLTVRGVRRDSCLEEGCTYQRMEITYSRFERRLVLPNDIGRCRIQTEFQLGMLLIRIHREAGE